MARLVTNFQGPAPAQEEYDRLVEEAGGSPLPVMTGPLPKVNEVAPPEPIDPTTSDASEGEAPNEPDPTGENEPVLSYPKAQPLTVNNDNTKLAEPQWHDYLLGQAPAPAPAPVAQVNETHDASTLASKAPNWYDFAPPPEYNGTLPALLALGAGAVNAAVAKGNKAKLALLGGGAIDALNTKLAAPGVDYKNRLEAAGKQAQMMATLRGAGGSNEALGWARLDLEKQKMDAAAKTAAEKAKLHEALDKIDSPETIAMQKAAAPFMGNEAYNLTGNQIQWGRTQYGMMARQEQGQANATTNFNRRQDAATEQRIIEDQLQKGRIDYREGKKIEGENRQIQYGLDQAQIPGLDYVGTHAPSDKLVAAATDIKSNYNKAMEEASNLERVSDSLSSLRAVKPFTYFMSDEAKALLAYAKEHQTLLSTALRGINQTGVLNTKFENDMIQSINPEVGSLDDIFNGKHIYHQLQTTLPSITKKQLAPYKYVFHGEDPESVNVNPAEPAPPPMGKKSNEKSEVKSIAKGAAKQTQKMLNTGKQVLEAATQKFTGMSATVNPDGTLTVTDKDGKRSKIAPGSFADAFKAGGGVIH